MNLTTRGSVYTSASSRAQPLHMGAALKSSRTWRWRDFASSSARSRLWVQTMSLCSTTIAVLSLLRRYSGHMGGKAPHQFPDPNGSFGRPTGMTATLSEFLLRRSHQDLIHRHTALPGDNVGDHVGDVLGFEPLDRRIQLGRLLAHFGTDVADQLGLDGA